MVQSCGWIQNRFLLQFVNNLIIYSALQRSEQEGSRVSKAEPLKRQEDDCQFNDNFWTQINKKKKKKHIELWISAWGEALTVSLPAIWICHRAYSSILVLWSARRSRRRWWKNSPALNLTHGRSHHSHGHIWIRCLDIQFAKGLLCFVAEGFRAALILYQNDRVPERIQG